ncbi:MAG: ribosome recycling factor [Deltaproteobacteria bacterium]|jgi:ribosome recycling factor|nr:ribosome recycling factor [Deltaproteobacteria bacterium]
MVNEYLEELKDSMDEVTSNLKKDLAKVRTGRANLSILNGITIDYYGNQTPINQVANVKIADARLITVKPWEKAMLAPLEKAIIAANIGITPANDGEIIRLPIPPLTEERRKDIVKSIKATGEEYKITLRQQRRETNDLLKEAKKEGDISEDEMKRGLDKVQEITDKHTDIVDKIIEKKTEEILNF